MRQQTIPFLVVLLLAACTLQPADQRVSTGEVGAVNGQAACPPDPHEPHPALTVDVRCPKVGEEFTLTVSNSTVEHPYYTITLDDAIFLARLTYDGQYTYGEDIASFEILSAQASEWEMVITLKALQEGEFTFGISSTGLVGGMWLGDGYGIVLISVGR
jgi:hypothetical protein